MEEMALAQVSPETTADYGVQKGDPAWQEQMVLQYAPLIKYIASRLAFRLPSHIPL
jgi:DNA-directed RNA polymerase specialized sigma subunit